MEARRKTRPGVLVWTPAPPAQNSSSAEDSCEDKDDFFTQMDENGIIGLSEDLEEMDLGHDECEPPESPEPGSPEELDLVCLVEKPADGLSFDVKKSREDRVPSTRQCLVNFLFIPENYQLLQYSYFSSENLKSKTFWIFKY